MTPERWREVKAVLGEALDHPSGERAAVLERACGADVALRSEVESLLASARGGADPDSLPAMRAAIAAEAAAIGAVGEPAGDSVLRPLLDDALGHQYEIVRPLGSGGMGAVYLAWERALDRPVAIKVLRPDLAGASASRQRFRREARIVAQLSHPGILPLYSFGEVRGLWYFVMGYVRGVSLAEHLRLRGRLPWYEARRIVVDLADALACAHRHGVVHRDIKPANVLLDEESGRAVLTDFGISKLHDGDVLTAADAVVGTPRYMSPEQARGAPDVDERSDVYSLGAVAYAMLTGREPVPWRGADDATARQLAEEAAALRRVAPGVPEDLAAVVARCLEWDRTLRWPDARGLKAALDRTHDGAPAPAGAPPDVSGYGPYALLWALAWSALAALTARSPDGAGWLVLVALVVPLGLALHVWNVERRDLPPTELARLAFQPPRWWGMWWPRALRRPGDLWPHLPWQARVVRRGLSACLVALPLLVLVQGRLAGVGGPAASDAVLRYGPAAEWVVALCGIVLAGGALAWSRVRGLTAREAAHLLFGATMPSPAWRAPNVARLLGPASDDVRPPEPDDAADHARAVGELARLLPPAVAHVGVVAADVARRVATAVAAADRELGALARDASVAEVDRLTARLTALEDASAHDADGDVRELHDLVRRQLDVLHRMRRHHDAVCHRRTRLLDGARGIWTQLYAVRDAAAGPAEACAPAITRLRALCDETAALIAAAAPAPPSRG